MPAHLFPVAAALLFFVPGRLVKGEASKDKSVIQTFVGETVILPCQIQVPENKEVPTVEWSKDGLKPNISFLYRNSCETFEEKNSVFDYRTNLFMKEVKYGNVSLRLSNVRLSDAGTYECKCAHKVITTVELSVVAVSELKLSVVPEVVPVTVQCEASCWFPQPNMTFLDAQGTVVSAKDPKSDFRDGCFYVTRRATVQTGNGSCLSMITCKVQQSKTNQIKVTKIYIPNECSRCYTISFAIAVVAVVLIVLTAIALLKCSHFGSECKLGQNPVQNVDGPMSKLRDQDEAILKRTKELNDLNDLKSKQSPVACPLVQPTIDRNPNPSKSSAASADSNHPKSGNISQNQGSNPSVSIQSPATSLQIPTSHNNSNDDLFPNSGNVSPAAHPDFPAEGTHTGRLRRMSNSRSNSGKAQRTNSMSSLSGNPFRVLANLPEDGSAEPLLEEGKE